MTRSNELVWVCRPCFTTLTRINGDEREEERGPSLTEGDHSVEEPKGKDDSLGGTSEREGGIC
jgi:hypothetical protein